MANKYIVFGKLNDIAIYIPKILQYIGLQIYTTTASRYILYQPHRMKTDIGVLLNIGFNTTTQSCVVDLLSGVHIAFAFSFSMKWQTLILLFRNFQDSVIVHQSTASYIQLRSKTYDVDQSSVLVSNTVRPLLLLILWIDLDCSVDG